ncbi:hypothetical protein [Streptomyces griseosporeus]|uniref:hypothetical protein n=1 Tax=Streptomyces griseosporeus TaxID=1910 RepID=UPI00379F0FD7
MAKQIATGIPDERRRSVWKRHPLAIAPAVIALMVSGCDSEQKRDYAVPQDLCGTRVSADDLAPFLPGGNSLKVSGSSRSATDDCRVIVDDKVIMTATQVWVEEGETTASLAFSLALHAPKNSADDGRYWYSGNEAFGKTRGCIDKKYGHELYTALQAQGSEHRDADAMKRLIVSYTEQVEKSAKCSAGAGEE